MSRKSALQGISKIWLPFILAAFTALPACAMPAKQGNAAGSTTFEQMDKDNDGKVVLEEFRTAFPNMNEKAFVVIDKNGDSGIEHAEWYEFIEGHARGMQPAKMREGAPMNNIPGDPMIPPPDSNDLPLVRPPADF